MGEVLAENLAWRQRHDFELLGRSLSELTTEARRETLDVAESLRDSGGQVAEKLNNVAARGPFIVTGHQPGLIHPGVWVKNFAAAELAEQHGGVGLHIVIDADVCRSAAILVPSGTIDAPHLASVEFDRAAPVMPWEERRIVDDGRWRSFPERVHAAAAPFLSLPFLDQWWPIAVQRGAASGLVGAAISDSRHDAEVAWGCRNVELPQSRLCQTRAFRHFACALFAELPRFAASYNGAIADYRRAHGIRNHAHPVPNLAVKDGWQEAPFWIWTTGEPQRRPVFVRPTSGGLLVSDQRDLERRLPLTGPADAQNAAAELGLWEAAGVKLRPRALITTMFTRLAVADLFLHGIGGAKYDEATDAICKRFFGVVPPAFATLSGTLRLPIPHAKADLRAVGQLRTGLRELKFHPERKLDFSNLPAPQRRQAEILAAEKSRWIKTAKTPANAAERHRAITAANDGLQPLVVADRAKLEWQIAEARQAARASRVLDSREYASCLFPRNLLEQFLLDFSADAR
jgi:hypothetical protein